MRTLLAIDDSKFSEAAIQAVIQHLRPEQAEVCVLHVVEPLLLAPEFRQGNPEDMRVAEQRLLERRKELVGRAQQAIRKAGFNVQPAVKEDDHRAEIIDYAAQWNADLIVLGSHGRKGMDRFLLGSVAEFVARHASCSVWIVRTARP
jgi:nucleotide-binding universal stress UspA family protein